MPKREFSSVDRRDGSSNGDDLSQGISKAPKRRIDLGDRRESSSSAAAADGPNTSQESAFSPWTGRPFSSRYYSILETRRKLPVYLFKDKLMDVVKANEVVIVEGAYHPRAIRRTLSLPFFRAWVSLLTLLLPRSCLKRR
jgi:hypothetical protein